MKKFRPLPERPYVKSVAIKIRKTRLRDYFAKARAITEQMVRCPHDFGPDGLEAMCKQCGCIRPRKPHHD